ncbi:glycosyltransferase family 2 protein [Roseateles violae]|uniref:Glycosyltransferase family 2 protein n=1 Tax=Roseateles violae TaxID=3058042 RepID=A0ABT8DRZ2_9BURK|nr:glycosyltransferase family 2 protein [Pelomonas sp. PFR6]MDN3920947.1 glycosyltransferase family 2 protein [Pelomonas sp. PFR6]
MSLGTTPPLVSICVVTYNHAGFIEDCLERLARQITTFPYEVIVGVDPSTDGTADIVDAVAARHPGRFRVMHHSERLGAFGNFRHTHHAARGEFVAHMDGDDIAYPEKLQQQVTALLNDKAASLCGHVVDLIALDNSSLSAQFPTQAEPQQRLFLDDALTKGSLFVHSSFMYRRQFASHLFGSSPEVIDYFFLIGFLIHGHAINLSQPLGAYRITAGGLTLALGQRKRVALFMDAYEDLLTRKIGPKDLILATAMADCSKLLFSDRELRARFLRMVFAAKRLPNPFRVLAIRRAKRLHGKVLQQAFQAS